MEPAEADVRAIHTESLPYLLFALGENTYGINSAFVKSIERLGDVTPVEKDPEARGGVLYQGRFIHLIDIRKKFGLDTQIDEFEKTVQPERRIKDHEHWVRELEKSVKENTKFTLTDDPHKCDFGKWYYNYTASNNILKHQLKAIEIPHAAVHETAKAIEELMVENKQEEALKKIEELKETHYKTTIHILSNLREMVESSLNELYIVIEAKSYMKGLIVDSIVGVEDLNQRFDAPHELGKIEYVDFLGQRKSDKSIVIVLNDLI